jgi:phospholipase/lecithinase/hemolysin
MMPGLPRMLRAALLLIAAVPLLAGAGHWPAVGAGKRYSDLLIFGDSLTDTGNVYMLTKFLSSLDPPLVPVASPDAPYLRGRFSDGKVWVETLADLVRFPQAALPAGMTLVGSPFPIETLPGWGNNYAIAGARTGAGGTFDALHIATGLKAQIEWFISRHGDAADPDALYVVLAGGNDIRDAANIADRKQRRAAARLAAENYRDAVARLAAVGAKTIIVGNSADVGRTPESRLVLDNAAFATDATLAFNRALFRLLDELAAHSDIKLIKIDIFRLFDAIIRDALLRDGHEFGVTEVDKPCLYFPDTDNYGAGTVSCEVSLFADIHHPTAKVHRILGEVAAACLPSRHRRHDTRVEDSDRGPSLRRFCETKPGDRRWRAFARHRSAPAGAFPASWQGRAEGADESYGAR